MHRNYKKEYILDVAGELSRLEDAGYEAERGNLTEDVQEFRQLILPNGQDGNMVKSSATVSKMGAVVAVMTYLIDEDREATPTLIYDQFFENMSPNGQRFIVAHEVGHLVNGDIGTPEKAVAAMASGDVDLSDVAIDGRNIMHEYLADEFAADVNGRGPTVRAMREFRHMMVRNSWLGFDYDELDRRIAHIRRYRKPKENNRAR